MPPLLALVSLEKGSPTPPAIPSPNLRACPSAWAAALLTTLALGGLQLL